MAVLLVVFAHMNFPFTSNGFVGVDIFFVLSGFLITRHMVTEYLSNRAATGRAGWISFTGFYLRRARKILPAAFFVIAGIYLVGTFQGISTGKDIRLASDATWALFFLANLNFMAQEVTYFGVPTSQSPFLHYWSLSVEEQFYLLWPLFFMTTTSLGGFKLVGVIFHWKNRLKLSLFFMISISLFVYCYQLIVGATSGYYSSLGRFWEFGFGALIALSGEIRKSLQLRVFKASAFSMSILAFVFLDQSYFRYWIIVIVLLTGLLLSQIVHQESSYTLKLILENKLMLYIGKISFSLYLVHFPVIVFFENAGLKTSSLNAVYMLPSMFLLGALVYREVEARGMKISLPEVSKKSAARRTRYFPVNKDGLRYSCVGVIALIFFLNFQQANGLPIFSSFFKPQVGLVWTPPKSYVETETSGSLQTLGEPVLIESQLESNWNRILSSSLNLTDLPEGISPSPSQLDAERLSIWRNCLVIEVKTAACNSGDDSAGKKVYIFGDSYALAIKPMVFESRQSSDSQVISWIRGQCIVSSIKRTSERLFQDCLEHRNAFYAEIDQSRPSLVIVSSLTSNEYVGSAQDLYQSLVSEYRKIVKYADNVIVIGETPFGADPRVCLGTGTSLSKCSGSSLSRMEERLMTAKAAKAAGASFLDITPWLCLNGKCPVVIDGVLSTYDGGHLTNSLSEKLAPLFMSELSRLGMTY